MNSRILVQGYVVLLLLLLVGACGPAATPVAPLSTAGSPRTRPGTEMPSPVGVTVLPATAPAVTPMPTAAPTFPPPAPTAESPMATTAPLPTATGTPEGPAILYFRATVEEADPGDTIVLEWVKKSCPVQLRSSGR